MTNAASIVGKIVGKGKKSSSVLDKAYGKKKKEKDNEKEDDEESD